MQGGPQRWQLPLMSVAALLSVRLGVSMTLTLQHAYAIAHSRESHFWSYLRMAESMLSGPSKMKRRWTMIWHLLAAYAHPWLWLCRPQSFRGVVWALFAVAQLAYSLNAAPHSHPPRV